MVDFPAITRAALEASNVAIASQGKSAAQLAIDHDAAAEAHRKAATEDSPCRWMHGEHARVHAMTAEAMRTIARRHG